MRRLESFEEKTLAIGVHIDRPEGHHRGNTRTGRYRHVLNLLILSAPFLAGAILLRGLQVHLDTFHGADEPHWHYPATLAVAEDPGHVWNTDMSTSTTPFFHMLFAFAGRVVGFEIWKLRALNVLISLLATVLLLRLLEQWRIDRSFAPLPYVLVFLLSPYFFGNSFILTTDSLSIALGLAAVLLLLKYLHGSSTGVMLMLSLVLCLATLTRQSNAALVIVALAGIWTSSLKGAQKRPATGLLALALLPLAAFVVHWGGVVPPANQQWFGQPGVVSLRVVLFTLALVGLYSVFFDPRRYLKIAGNAGERKILLFSGVAGLLLVTLFPLRETDDNGFLWTLSSQFPSVLGTSILFWVLIVSGLFTVASQCRENRVNITVWSVTLCMVLPFAASRVVHQKYIDPSVIVALSLICAAQTGWTNRRLAALLPLYAGFLSYFVLSLIRS
jgi:4-amino-4-deoxy-L-arabinose transferase-like glycosyltransferase